jgi:hypothetical protein
MALDEHVGGPPLEARGISKRFGGVQAVMRRGELIYVGTRPRRTEGERPDGALGGVVGHLQAGKPSPHFSNQDVHRGPGSTITLL